MSKKYNLRAFTIILLLSTSPLFAVDSTTASNQDQIGNMISLCGTKISAVDQKLSLFTYPPKPILSTKSSFLESKDKKKARDINNAKMLSDWTDQIARIDYIKNDYLKLLQQTKDWYKRNNDEVRKIAPAKVIEKSIEYVHNCNLYVDSIADELYWFQGKTPPGGFKNGMSKGYFDKQFSQEVIAKSLKK